jgi:hypothetical protein
LRLVFEKFQKYNLTLNPGKCEFLKDEIVFLGHKINKMGVFPNVDLKVIQNYKKPNCIKDVRGFLSFIGFFRNHIENFAELAEPIVNILRKDKKK